MPQEPLEVMGPGRFVDEPGETRGGEEDEEQAPRSWPGGLVHRYGRAFAIDRRRPARARPNRRRRAGRHPIRALAHPTKVAEEAGRGPKNELRSAARDPC